MCLYICFHIHISNYKCRPAFLLSDLSVNLTELLLCNLARCSAHKILCISIHWEWDDLSDILLVSDVYKRQVQVSHVKNCCFPHRPDSSHQAHFPAHPQDCQSIHTPLITCAALFVIAFGNGLFKGNLQALVGQMYDTPCLLYTSHSRR